MPYLFLMLGYPGSGKTTFSKLLSQEYGLVHFNTDEIRRHMFTTRDEIIDVKLNPYVIGALDYAAEATLRTGVSAIFDANHNTVSERERRGAMAKRYGARTIIVWVKAAADIAWQRESQRRTDRAYVPIPDVRYNELVAALEEPTDNEMVITLDAESSPEEQLRVFIAEMQRRGFSVPG